MGGQNDTWRFTNPFARQPLRLRIEALLSAEGYESPDSIPVVEFESALEFTEIQSREGVSATLQPSRFENPAGTPTGCYTAENRLELRDGSWTRASKAFSPLLNLAGRGLGFWVHGDGQGEVLNLQLASPAFLGGGLSNHYLDIDWRGWRYFNLIESNADQIGRFDWPYARSASLWRSREHQLAGDAYPNLHVWVSYDRLERVDLWTNNLPAEGTATCYLSPIRGVPLKPVTLRNPTVTLGGRKLVFPTDLESGSYLEFLSPADCTLYDAHGEPIGQILSQGDLPTVESGENEVTFSCEGPDGFSARARVTVMLLGDPL